MLEMEIDFSCLTWKYTALALDQKWRITFNIIYVNLKQEEKEYLAFSHGSACLTETAVLPSLILVIFP